VKCGTDMEQPRLRSGPHLREKMPLCSRARDIQCNPNAGLPDHEVTIDRTIAATQNVTPARRDALVPASRVDPVQLHPIYWQTWASWQRTSSDSVPPPK